MILCSFSFLCSFGVKSRLTLGFSFFRCERVNGGRSRVFRWWFYDLHALPAVVSNNAALIIVGDP
jgi:hypothetical protein